MVVGLHGTGDARQERIPADYPFEHAKELLHEYLDVREYFHGDFYPLTEYTQSGDSWMAYQLDRPEQGDGLVVVLKRPGSPFTRAQLRLSGLQPEAAYEIVNIDKASTHKRPGLELTENGVDVELAGNPDSALLRYRVCEETDETE